MEKEFNVDPQSIIPLAGLFVLMLVVTIIPQWQARRRKKKQVAEITPGTQVMTVGGIIGKVTRLDQEENRVHIEIAPGVEIQVIIDAIGRPIPKSEVLEDETSEDQEN
jgi:preprotein translocase subunit YajC